MVDEETVRSVAANARLHVSDDEVEQLTADLDDILDAFESLDDIDTEGVDPAFHPIDLDREPRPDETEPSLSQEQALSNTDNDEDGFFKGPRAT
ncbi:MAG: Asp-tRNA(Asn)/Glu-tRNA(Gln) amidotransferase subunit GatC [Candidatus Nanohaloarchaeota archaeon QJJ-5]|nr:Asp-tRNA(Asn)/Glu-tRNA(Gln) amidotransferase subunit GatC [Candidatus Nanohaloarchaeota archaeon QJJ-5]